MSKKIKEVVGKLTESEKEEFKDVIEECLQREKDIEENRKASQKALVELQKDIELFCKSFSTFTSDLEKLKKELIILKAQVKNNSNGELN